MERGVKKVSGRSAAREMNVASIQLPRPEGTRGLDLGIKGRGGVGANAGAKRAMGTHEVDADGGDVALGVGIVGETEEKARFADAGVTDQLRRRGVEGGNFGETLSFDEGRISAQIWAERGGRSGIPRGRIDVVSSFHDGSDSGAHQELEEVVTAVHAGKGGERGTSASRNLPGGRDVGGTEEERVDGEPRARRTVVATRPGGGRGHEGDVALTTRGSSCLNAACAQTSNGRRNEWTLNWCCEADKMQPTKKGIFLTTSQTPSDSNNPHRTHSSSTHSKSPSFGMKSGAGSTVLAGRFHSHHLQNT